MTNETKKETRVEGTDSPPPGVGPDVAREPQRLPRFGQVTDFFARGGEMGERMRALDWSQTPLGPVETWPQSLKTAVRILLNSRYPMFLWWGRELTYIYNDAYIPVLGTRHPEALGQSPREIWADVWDVLGPQTDVVLNEGRATWNESVLLVMQRSGYNEETYFTFSYSPVPDDTGGVGGVFCACTEDTQRVIGERQLALLRDLAATTANCRTWEEACQLSADALRSNAHDLPFAMIYIAQPDGSCLSLAGASGIEQGHPAAPAVISLAEHSPWPLAGVLGGRETVVVEHLREVVEGSLPTGVWNEPPTRAALIPLAGAGQTGRGGVLIVGLNPFRLFDDGYRNFLTLISSQISANIASAEAYEEEKKRAETLAELYRARTAFFSNVSHEFRTPLTLMLGPVEDLLARGDAELTPAARAQLEVVHRNSLRMHKLVNTMLDFSRIEDGRVQANFAPVDLASYTAELAAAFRPAIERAGLRLNVDCPPLPEPVHVDRDMWEKIVLNLLSNAFKFTLQGAIEVRMETIDRQARLTVRDTGVGIPAGEMPRVFERFHRIDDARGRTHEGTGIGLALVQELVKLHGGTVTAESVLNEGSQFCVTVPLGTAHLDPERIRPDSGLSSTKAAAGAIAREALLWLTEGEVEQDVEQPWARTSHPSFPFPAGESNQVPVHRPRIVWADDNADMREYVRRLLSERFDVEAVADGAAALHAIRTHPPDLVLSDVMMSNLDGVGLLRALRADPELRDIPIILLSARAGEEARITGLESGADDYLIKPFSAKELIARVATHVNMARVRRQAAEALRESEARKRAIFQMALDCIITIDHEGKVIEFNPAAERTFGYHRDEVLGQELAGLILPPLLRERHRLGMAHYLATGEGPILDQRIEMPAIRADGSEFPAELTVTRIPAYDPPQFTAYLRDITDRKEAEQRLRTQYMVSRVLAESSTLNEAASKILRAICGQLGWQAGALWYVDQNAKVLRCSKVYHLPAVRVPRFKTITREGTFARGIGLPGRVWASGRAAWIPDVARDDNFPRGAVATAEGLRGAIGLPITLNEEVVGVIEFFSSEIRQPDEDLLQMMTAIGAQVGQFLERKRAEGALRASEERFRSMANATPAIIWTADPTGAITFHNQRWLDYTGLTPEENVRNWPARVLHPDDLERCIQAWTYALEHGTDYEIELRNRRRDGVYRWFLTRATPIRDVTGRIVEWYGSTTDIHASKQAEETLRGLVQEKDVLLREIHHRVKNNLQVISSLIDLQAGNLPDPAVRAVLADMSDRVRAMSVVHERLYNAGNLAEVDFAAYARSLLETLWQVHGVIAANVTLNMELDPLTLPVEPAIPLGLILNELATNTLKHAFHNRDDCTVTVGLKQEPAGEVLLWVRDNGVGLPEKLDLQQPNTLGLRLVQMLTRQLRGTMEVACDTGTEFRVRFTAAQR